MNLFKKTFPNFPFFLFVKKLKFVLGDCQNILDLGCGTHSPVSLLRFNYIVGIDSYRPNIKKARENKTHNKLILADIRKIKEIFSPKSFDAIVALDVIEHLSKNDGKKLITDMGKIAKKKIVIFTPNGFLTQKGDGNNFEEHLSGWKVSELRRLGFNVHGFYGFKKLRANDYSLRFRPKFIWGIISVVSDLYFWNHPEKARALLCIKEI